MRVPQAIVIKSVMIALRLLIDLKVKWRKRRGVMGGGEEGLRYGTGMVFWSEGGIDAEEPKVR